MQAGMRRVLPILALFVVVLLPACTQEEEPVANRFERQKAEIENKARAFEAQVENEVSAAEARLENEADMQLNRAPAEDANAAEGNASR